MLCTDSIKELGRKIRTQEVQQKIIIVYGVLLILYNLIFHAGELSEKLYQYGGTILLCVFCYFFVWFIGVINMKLAFSLKKYFGFICVGLSIICALGAIVFGIHYFINEFTEMPYVMLTMSFAFSRVAYIAKEE